MRWGATAVVLPRFEIDTFLAAIEEHRITALSAAPPTVLARTDRTPDNPHRTTKDRA